jgi:hypothetical protein
MRVIARHAAATHGSMAGALVVSAAVSAVVVSALLVQWVAGAAVAAPAVVVAGSFKAIEGADYRAEGAAGAAAPQRVAPQRRH